MDELQAVMLSSAFRALLEGDPSAAALFVAKIKPSVLRNGAHKDAIRGLLALIEDRAVATR